MSILTYWANGATQKVPATNDLHRSLIIACSYGSLDVVSKILASEHFPQDQLISGLYTAGHHNLLEIVKELLAYTDDVQPFIDSYYKQSCSKGWLTTLCYLCEHHSPDVYANDGIALYSAATEGHAAVVDYLLSHYLQFDKFQAFTDSCEDGHKDVAEVFLRHEMCSDSRCQCGPVRQI